MCGHNLEVFLPGIYEIYSKSRETTNLEAMSPGGLGFVELLFHVIGDRVGIQDAIDEGDQNFQFVLE